MTSILDDTSENKKPEFKYRIEAVEPTNAPDGMPEGEWHSYLLVRGTSKIEGLKPGSLLDVTQHAESVIEGLNERYAKGSSAYVSSKKKK